MTTLAEHTRSMMAYSRWADARILGACAGITDAQYGEIRHRLEHMLGTQRWWYLNWAGAPETYDDPVLPSLADAVRAYADMHAKYEALFGGLNDAAWRRREAWWKPWGYDVTLEMGETAFQVVYHGIQHRAEIAELISAWGHSPGDMDYLDYLRDARGIVLD